LLVNVQIDQFCIMTTGSIVHTPLLSYIIVATA